MTGMPALTPDQIKRRDWVATYPTREAALALIAWLKAADWERVSQLDRRLATIGIDWTGSFDAAAERCWEVYGYRELEAAVVARRTAEVTHTALCGGATGGSGDVSRPVTPAAPSARPEGDMTATYGFTRRT